VLRGVTISEVEKAIFGENMIMVNVGAETNTPVTLMHGRRKAKLI